MNRDIIKLELPKEAKYISVARLAISGISMGMGFDIDCIEDLKVSIAEACINALRTTEDEGIKLEFEVNKDNILARVKDVKDVENTGLEELRMGQLIINSLMDHVEFTDFGIEMTKQLGVDADDYE